MEGALLFADGQARRLSLEEGAAYDGPGILWIHLEGKDEADLAYLHRLKDIPEVAVSALAATETRPRCDRIDEGAILNLRGPGNLDPEDSDPLVSIRFWVLEQKVVTLSRRRLNATEKVFGLMEAGRIHDSGDLVSAFARAISTELDPQVAALGDTLDESESKLEEANLYGLRRSIALARSEAIGFRRFVAPDRDALRTLVEHDFDWLAPDDRLHIVEAADRFARMTEELEAVRERAALLHEQITDMRAEQLDQRSLLIAIVALVFLPLTYITGLFGMNVDDIPFSHGRHGFWWVTGLTIVIALAISAYFSWKNWLRR